MTSGPLFFNAFRSPCQLYHKNLKRVLEPSLHSDSRQIGGEQLMIRVLAAPGLMPDLNDYSPLRGTLPCVLKWRTAEQR
jgi:hypothetical protein